MCSKRAARQSMWTGPAGAGLGAAVGATDGGAAGGTAWEGSTGTTRAGDGEGDGDGECEWPLWAAAGRAAAIRSRSAAAARRFRGESSIRGGYPRTSARATDRSGGGGMVL